MAMTFTEALHEIDELTRRLETLGEGEGARAVMREQVDIIERGTRAMVAGRGGHIVTTRNGADSSSMQAKGPMIPYIRPLLLRQRDAGKEEIEEALREEAEQA